MHVDPSAPSLAPRELRQAVRAGVHAAPTAGYCSGFVQANVVILPRAHAWDFLLLCQRNPRPLPLLEVYDPGAVAGPRFAPESDIRTDCPKYVVLQKGQTSYVTDISPYWREDLVTFLIGCSFTFETGLLAAGVPVRHIEMGRNVPMYRTCLQMTPAGVFSGPMVVSMRPVPASLVSAAVLATAAFPAVHGAPVSVGRPETLGIADINKPDYGDPVDILNTELPLFWACGVSGLSAVTHSNLDFAITHAPGHMLVCDVRDTELAR